MMNLFLIELLRHRRLALSFAFAHLLALYFLLSIGIPLLVFPIGRVALLVEACAAVAFGVFQMSLHKRNNDWLYLLHRPLAPQRIFFALTLAGSVVCAVVLLLPLLLFILMLDSNDLRGVELHHYAVLLHVAPLVIAAYLCGCFAQLGSSRLSFMAATITTTFLYMQVSALTLIVSPALVLWAFWLAGSSFKADLSQPPRQTLAVVFQQIPIQYGCLWAAALIFTMTASGWYALTTGSPYLNPLPGGDAELRQMPPAALFKYGLQQSAHPDAAFLQQQVSLGEALHVNTPVFMPDYPLRYQVPVAENKLVLADAERGLSWVFSHDAMLYAGMDSNSSALKGWLGPDGFHDATAMPAARFSSVPLAATNEFLLDQHNLYYIDWDQQQLYLRYHDTSDDRLLDSLVINENLTTLMTTSSLLIFRSAELPQSELQLIPRARVTLPSPGNTDYRWIAVLELIDGYLVSALTDLTAVTIPADFFHYGKAHLQIYRTHADSSVVDEIINLPVPAGFSRALIYRDFVLSPGMRFLTDVFWGWYVDKTHERMTAYTEFSASVWAIAALGSALSAALTAWLLRASAWSASRKRYWIIANAVTGPIGLLAYWVGYHVRQLPRLLSGAQSGTR